MDVAGAVVGLIVLSPILLLTVLFICCVSPGPIFFRHERAGLGGRPFIMWKFRTMPPDADTHEHESYVLDLANKNAVLAKLDGHCKLIPFGSWLRKLCIDELPQLINVLRGEMSLVGPRPDVVSYEEYQPWQRRRFEVLPGMTGLWQVSGKNETTFEEMIQLDIAYVEQRAFWLDVRILLRTVPTIARQCLNRSQRRHKGS
jgi:lipopolysaccharide/colanic/teichoic acid biosynthesis glycosyltransferase